MAHAVVSHPVRWLALSLALGVAPWSAGAFDANKLDVLETTNVCKYCALHEAPMSGLDIRSAELQNTN